MFDAPLDVLYVWIGLGAVSVAVLGIVLAFPTGSPANVGALADAIDAVAASEYQAQDRVRVSADEIRLGPETIGVRTDGGTAHARVEYGPVTPVSDGPLRDVLAGESPKSVFEDVDEFQSAIDRAQRHNHTWREPPDTLRIRRVTWGEVDATLVG